MEEAKASRSDSKGGQKWGLPVHLGDRTQGAGRGPAPARRGAPCPWPRRSRASEALGAGEGEPGVNLIPSSSSNDGAPILCSWSHQFERKILLPGMWALNRRLPMAGLS